LLWTEWSLYTDKRRQQVVPLTAW